MGLGIGRIVLAPLSEISGRRLIYINALSLFTILIIPCAVAKNIETVIVVRFFAYVVLSYHFCNSAKVDTTTQCISGLSDDIKCPGTVAEIVDDEHPALAF